MPTCPECGSLNIQFEINWYCKELCPGAWCHVFKEEWHCRRCNHVWDATE